MAIFKGGRNRCIDVTVVSGMPSYVKLTAFSIKTIFKSLNSFRFADISSLLRCEIFKSSIYFNIG